MEQGTLSTMNLKQCSWRRVKNVSLCLLFCVMISAPQIKVHSVHSGRCSDCGDPICFHKSSPCGITSGMGVCTDDCCVLRGVCIIFIRWIGAADALGCSLTTSNTDRAIGSSYALLFSLFKHIFEAYPVRPHKAPGSAD